MCHHIVVEQKIIFIWLTSMDVVERPIAHNFILLFTMTSDTILSLTQKQLN